MRTFVVALGLLFIACHQDGTALIKPAPGVPCGNAGVPCYDGQPLKFTGDCCTQGYICGGGFPNIGCPADSCCFEDYGAPQNADGTHRFARIDKKWKASP